MSESTSGPQNGNPDPAEFARNMAEVAAKSQQLVTQFLQKQAADGAQQNADPLNIGNAFLELTTRMMNNPQQILEAQMGLWQSYMDLWQSTAQRMLGDEARPVIEPDRGDKRFKDPAWQENHVFDFIKQQLGEFLKQPELLSEIQPLLRKMKYESYIELNEAPVVVK